MLLHQKKQESSKWLKIYLLKCRKLPWKEECAKLEKQPPSLTEISPCSGKIRNLPRSRKFWISKERSPLQKAFTSTTDRMSPQLGLDLVSDRSWLLSRWLLETSMFIPRQTTNPKTLIPMRALAIMYPSEALGFLRLVNKIWSNRMLIPRSPQLRRCKENPTRSSKSLHQKWRSKDLLQPGRQHRRLLQKPGLTGINTSKKSSRHTWPKHCPPT